MQGRAWESSRESAGRRTACQCRASATPSRPLSSAPGPGGASDCRALIVGGSSAVSPPSRNGSPRRTRARGRCSRGRKRRCSPGCRCPGWCAGPAGSPCSCAKGRARDRRQPLRDSAGAARHRPAEDPRLQLVLSRHGGRDVHHPGTGWAGAAAGEHRTGREPRRDDAGDRVQRRGGARNARSRRWTSPASSPSRR